ncbi:MULTISPECIES: SusC/RagA family TonB-linked outer membrane protein [Elizabethkingia]|uniref:SusC/RagA family TonB-linked outer membrane protein n=1 Tax=Elizabethkingia TaxID=308865 RepID=UPI000442B5CE|nr:MULTISPECIES: SusC/RagA family TonB-linked outer membrane protein [Elizabethkingia]MDX8568380.1 SusC/RagA family TonB-linked outer membrane protein [Elizabethkingia sp. HX XZB]CDN75305.1 putative outer membrane protein [Elizabethkingia anophelis]CDN76932.1 putative outer membrane protein [Elizabethkingia anophelis]
MNKKVLQVSCLVAAFYFGADVHAQTKKNDTVTKEKAIEEVVMIGYGSQKKENVTGSIGVISAKDLADKPNPNPISSIQGKVAGVQIQNSGAPGGSPRVDIRGISSLSGKTVFIVDGMITDDISFLNPQDVESMSILKDPSSLAIFGARASNGAVIIKTKSGKNKTVFNFSSYIGVKTVTNIPKMANSDQYVELYNEKLRNEGVTDPTKFISRANYPANTDWFNEVLKTGFITSNDFSASGTLAKKLNYFASIGYLDDGGTLAAGRGVNSGNNFQRLNTRANLTYKINNNISVGNNFTWSHINTNIASNPLLAAYGAPPVYYPVNPATGNYDPFSLISLANPRATLDLLRSKEKQDRILNNIWAEVKFLKDFSFKVSYTIDHTNSYKYEYNAINNYNPNQTPTRSNLITRDTRTEGYVWDNILSWKKNFNQHHLEVLGGFSRTQNYYHGIYSKVFDIPYTGHDRDLVLSNGVDLVTFTSNKDVDMVPYKNRIESLFGRLNYDYAGKYLVNASVRRDGATGFSSNNRFKTFPAVSVGWVISKEGFMSNQNLFNLLKLRASWGKLGNPDITRGYDKLTTIINSGAYFGGIGNPAETVTKIVNTDIDWETTTGRDIGVEMALLNNKLKIEATYFDKDSKNVVYGINQPSISGASNWAEFITNAYSFNNRGFEASVNYDTKISENIRLGVYANITTIKNKITSVYLDSYNEPGAHLFGSTIIRLQTGQPVGSYYGYQVAGVFQNQSDINAAPQQTNAAVGGFKFADLDGNGVIDARDKTFLGSPIPKYTYGFGFNLSVYDFDFAMDFQGVQGNKIYNYNREQRYGNENWDLDFYKNRWQGVGTSNSYPMTTNNQAIILPSSFFVEDGSFFRIRNIQLGYTLPKEFTKQLAVQKLRLYFSAQNPWTSFKYNGFSPEIMNSDRVQMGIDNNIYPISAIYTFGMNLTF